MKKRKILVVIVSYNSAHLMKQTVSSVRETLPSGSRQLVAVDNASTDGITEWLQEQEDLILVKNDRNLGFGPACNQGVRAAGADFCDYDIFLLNNDARLVKGAMEHLLEALCESEDIGAAGAVSNYAGNHQQLDVEFERVADYLAFGEELNRTPMAPMERVRLSGFAMLIRRTVWDAVGGFDEDFAPGYFEDDALCMEILKRGFRLKLVPNSFIYHAGSQSFSKTDYNSLLVSHHQLFMDKYGFDILDYAYPDDAAISGLPFRSEDSFRLLEIGSGLGENLKRLREFCPNSQLAGFEPDTALYGISKATENVFSDFSELAGHYSKGFFDVLLVDTKLFSSLEEETKKGLVGLCREDALLLKKNRDYQQFPFENVKLIIWDLDDTLWRGTLSEEKVSLPTANAKLIQRLTDHGIINSISSKNDEAPVKQELTRAGIWKYFVFNSINWEEKGGQIAEKIQSMNLRPDNVLFIDDNPRNLEEAGYHLKELMTASPDIIPYLSVWLDGRIPRDTSHKRLSEYQLLEKKRAAEGKNSSKEEFLFESNIRLTLNRNCLEEIERIHELVARTNQLNYTKNRDDRELLKKLILNDWNESAYIRVKDRFGDYGIVGFYCYNTREKVMEHFLFSCRVLGMGVEQYIYNKLGCPDFEIKEPVASPLKKELPVPWIMEDTEAAITVDEQKENRVRILLKGPCDMSAIEPYLSGGSITTEFNFINDRGFVTTGQNHTMHIVESRRLSEAQIDAITEQVPFIIKEDFETKLFSEEYHIICLSLLQDLSAGLYRNKETGAYISFSSRNYDLTSPQFRDRFISGEIQGHQFPFTKELLESFAEDWEFIGNTPLELLLENLDYIYDNAPGNPLFILLLGSETDYEGENEEFAGMSEIYREINPVIQAFAEDHDRVRVINFTDYVHSQEDFEGCVNHFSRNVYYEIAGKVCDYINEAVDRLLASRSYKAGSSASDEKKRLREKERAEFDNSSMFSGFSLPPKFYDAELRSGFFVDERTKRIWAVELDLLERFDAFCRKHDLRYYADNGTLLGAVRHGGFIPWDNDVDLVMMRPEFERMKALAAEEFSYPYTLQVSETIDGQDFSVSFARLRNAKTSAIEFCEAPRERNQGIFIDIFVMDDASDGDNKSEILWNAKLELWAAVTNPDLVRELADAGQTNIDAASIHNFTSLPMLEKVKAYEQFCLGHFGETQNIKVIQDHTPPMPRSYFDGIVYLPFEHLMLPAPLCYDAVLSRRYGQYMTPVQGSSQHNAIDMDPDMTYELNL